MDAVENALNLLTMAESTGARQLGRTTAHVHLCLRRDATFVTLHGMQAKILEDGYPNLRAKSIYQLGNFLERERGRLEPTKVVIDHYVYEATIHDLLATIAKLQKELDASSTLIRDLGKFGKVSQDGLTDP